MSEINRVTHWHVSTAMGAVYEKLLGALGTPEFGATVRQSVIQRGLDSWRVINVARHASEGYLTEQETTALIGLACLVLPMLPLNRRQLSADQPLTVSQLEQRFESRFDCLTPRERQICARAAAGMSVAATADELRTLVTH